MVLNTILAAAKLRFYLTEPRNTIVDSAILIEYLGSGAILALIARLSPSTGGYRLAPYTAGLVPILALVHVMCWRRRRGHQCPVSSQNNGDDSSDGSGRLWIKAAHQGLWFVYVSLLWVSVAIYVAFLLDSTTPADWRRWLTSCTVTQAGLALTWMIYYVQFHELEMERSITDTTTGWGPWSQAWGLAFIIQFGEMYHYTTWQRWPALGLEPPTLMDYWLWPLLPLVKLAMTALAPLIYLASLFATQTGVGGSTAKSPAFQTGGLGPLTLDRGHRMHKEHPSDCQYDVYTTMCRLVSIACQHLLPLTPRAVLPFLGCWALAYLDKWAISLGPLYYGYFLDSLATPEHALSAFTFYAGVQVLQRAVLSLRDRYRPTTTKIFREFEQRCKIFTHDVVNSKSLAFLDGPIWARQRHTVHHRTPLSSVFTVAVDSISIELFGAFLAIWHYRWRFPLSFLPLAVALGLCEILKGRILGRIAHDLESTWRMNHGDGNKVERELGKHCIIRSYSSESFHSKRYHLYLTTQGSNLFNRGNTSVLLRRLTSSLHKFLTCIGTVMCFHYVRQGRLQITDVAYFATYFSETYKPLTIVMDLVTRLHYEHRSGSELLTLIDAPVDAPEPPHVEPWKTTGGAIEFKNVCFSYSEAGKQRAVLRDITFKVPAETTTAIVGKTGAGKSTLFLLIMRLYDVCSGSITVNGTDVRQVKATDLRQNMVLVQQEGTLFDHTLDFNIKYGSARDGLRATTEKVSQAARRARIHDRIVTLPKGYDTVMYEDGFDLSGGENQRVRIARGLIHESQILLLDETTSALDILTEREVQSELIRGTKGKTCLMIAHRLPTVIHADQILVLDEGTIVERGSFAELMALPDGVFRKMWQAQLKQRVVDLTT